jgi:hypothetical protein
VGLLKYDELDHSSRKLGNLAIDTSQVVDRDSYSNVQS